MMTTRVAGVVAAIFMVASVTGCWEAPTEVDGPSLGGDRLPVQVEGEVYPETDTELGGIASLHENGCWTLDIGDGDRLLVFPEGFVKDETGSMMVSPDQSQQIGDGSHLTFVGARATVDAMPGGLDGFWGNHLAFCEPELGEFVVVDVLLGVSG
jgi:hypothetical protein